MDTTENKKSSEKEIKLFIFGDGPWMNEPDFEEFKHKGLNCMIIRNDCGAWCGYVLLPDNHPWKPLDYDDINVDIHGGITFKGSRRGFQEESWIGFDCSHSMDLIPSCEKFLLESRKRLKKIFPDAHKVLKNPTYKDINFVKEETKRLADQVKSAKLSMAPQPEDLATEKPQPVQE